MGAPYSLNLRDRVLAAADRGMPTRQIADIFMVRPVMVRPVWVRRVTQRRRESGETTPRKMGRPGPINIDRTRLAELVREYPDATLAELRDMLGIECAISLVSSALIKIDLSFTKGRSTPPSRARPMLQRLGPPASSARLTPTLALPVGRGVGAGVARYGTLALRSIYTQSSRLQTERLALSTY